MSKESVISVEAIVTNAMKLPGVRVNRKEFLAKIFGEKVSTEELTIILEDGSIKAGISPIKINKMAASLIENRTLKSSGASFVSGIPGGVAMAATIPADTLQFFGFSLRLAQEVAYLYGNKDFWDEDELDLDRVRVELMLFLGIMFGVGGSASLLKVLSSKISQKVLKDLPKKALTKKLYYRIIKQLGKLIGEKITKQTFAKAVSKAVPIFGGIVSGGLTYVSMKKMGSRLNNAFFESVNSSGEEELQADIKTVRKEMGDIIDAEFFEIADENEKDLVGNSK